MRLVMVLTFLVLMMIPIPVVSQQTGMSEGQTAQYLVTGDPDLTVNVTRSELRVISVQGTVITIRDTDVYLDGSSENRTLWLDLATGQGNATSTFQGYYFAISTGIGVGDPIYPGSDVLVQRNESRRYAGSSREVNFHNFTDSSGSTAYYWDRETGIYAEIVRREAGLSFHVNMNSTNIWSRDQQSPQDAGLSYLVPLLFVGVFVLAVLSVYKFESRRNSRKRTR